MFNPRLVLLALLACLALITNAQAPTEVVKKLQKEKKYKEASEYVNKLLAKQPENAELNLLKWRTYSKENGGAKENFKYLNKAIALDSAYSEAYCDRGEFYMDILRFDDARDDFETALRVAKTDSSVLAARLGLGSYYQFTRQQQKGIDISLLVLQNDSNNFQALNTLALGYQDLGQLEKALEILYKLERLDPKAIYAAVNIGFVLNKTKQYEKAITYFDKAEKLDKNSALVYSNRSEAKLNLKDYSGAMTDINKSIKLFPSNSYAYRVRALIYLDQKDTDKACEDLNIALRLKYTEQYDDDVKQMRDKYCIK